MGSLSRPRRGPKSTMDSITVARIMEAGQPTAKVYKIRAGMARAARSRRRWRPVKKAMKPRRKPQCMPLTAVAW